MQLSPKMLLVLSLLPVYIGRKVIICIYLPWSHTCFNYCTSSSVILFCCQALAMCISSANLQQLDT